MGASEQRTQDAILVGVAGWLQSALSCFPGSIEWGTLKLCGHIIPEVERIAVLARQCLSSGSPTYGAKESDQVPDQPAVSQRVHVQRVVACSFVHHGDRVRQ